MLLWGWQGMEAKAADENKFTIDDSAMDLEAYDKDKTQIVIEYTSGEDAYYLYVYSKDGYYFVNAPKVEVCHNNNSPMSLPSGDDRRSDGTYYRYYIGKASDYTENAYEVKISDGNPQQITYIKSINIEIISPVAGEVLPTNWTSPTKGVRLFLRWMKDGKTINGDVKADADTDYEATLQLYPLKGYRFDMNTIQVLPNKYNQIKFYDGTLINLSYSLSSRDTQTSNPDNTNPGNTNSEITSDSWKKWTINTDKAEHCDISRGYGYSDELDDKKTHLYLGVYPEDGYTFVEEPKVTWNGNPLQLLTDHAFNSEWHSYLLDDNGSGIIIVEAKTVKKETNVPETSAPASNDDSSEEPYKIIDGTKSTWNGSTTEGLTIRGDGDFAKFAGVRVDGNWIPSAHYEAKAGSTIVTLKPSYLASLAEGEHTVDIMWIDDSASTTFTVAANTAAAQPELDSVPKTGEGVMGWMPEILLLVAAGLTIMGALRLKKAK
ncbi:MAG TPA: hypothetical protein DGE56_00535 [Lachnospiraceae bacterium]|nr:hypothetical protein [Lachnospiraceae bacterium]